MQLRQTKEIKRRTSRKKEVKSYRKFSSFQSPGWDTGLSFSDGEEARIVTVHLLAIRCELVVNSQRVREVKILRIFFLVVICGGFTNHVCNIMDKRLFSKLNVINEF